MERPSFEQKPANIGVIGVGLGGSNLALEIAKQFNTNPEKIVLINLSSQDLTSVAQPIPMQNLCHLGKIKGQDGAGKNRDEGYNYVLENNDQLIEYAVKVADSEIIFVCYSLSGGTGSGIGPSLTALISSSTEFKRRLDQNKKPPIVIGIGICPDSTEGLKSMMNTVEALDENSNLGKYFLVDNNFAKDNDIKVKYTKINKSVASSLYRYLTQYGISQYGCLDKADRMSGLNIGGLHSFVILDSKSDGTVSKIETPFIHPSGARVKMCLSELNEVIYQNYKSYINSLGLDIGDQITGFFENTNEVNSIIHIAGFSNISKISEIYRNRLQYLKERAKLSSEEDRVGAGLKNIEEDSMWVKEHYNVDTSKSALDILRLGKESNS